MKLLEAAIEAKRSDVVKFLLVEEANVDYSVLSNVIMKTENE
jgi:hypothetical protein